MLREIRKNYRRLVAFLLTVAMTFTNIGTNLNVAFAAGEDESALFLVAGSDLGEAIQDAVENGDTFDFSSLELKAKSKSLKNSYEKLLKGEQVYRLDVAVDDAYAPEGTSMEVFYNAGSEDVVFLFANESDRVVSFRANVDGYETAPVTINPNAANVEDSEASYVEDYSNTTMIDDTSKKISGEVLNPTTEAAEENTEAENPSETEKTDASAETGAAEETSAVEETDASAETNEAETEASQEVGEPAEEIAGETMETSAEETIETPAEETSEAEEEATEAVEVESAQEPEVAEEAASNEIPEEIPAEGEVAPEEGAATASISLHQIQQVASNVTVLDDEAQDDVIVIETEEASQEEEITEDSNVELETEETASEAETEEETVAEETTAAAEENEAEVPESSEAEAESTEAAAGDENEAETEAGAEESSEAADADLAIEPETTEAAGEPVEDTVVKVEDTATASPSDALENAGGTSSKVEDEQLLEDDVTENAMVVLGELNSKALNTVTVWGSVNARAVKVAASELSITFETPVENEYVLYVNHVLSTDDAQYGKVQKISLSANDFIEGICGTSQFEYKKPGMVLLEAPEVSLDWFENEEGEMTAYVDLMYEVMDGWHVVSGNADENTDSEYGIAMFSAVYVGDLDSIDIVPDETKLVVKINYLNEAGIPVKNSYTLEVESAGEGAATAFDVSYELPAMEGYEYALSDDETRFVIEQNTLKNSDSFTEPGSVSVDVICIAGDAEYTVKHMFQSLDGTEYVENPDMTETLSGKIDSLTEAQEKSTLGFVAQEIAQKQIESDGTVVEVKYDRVDCTLIYDTMGGSYIPSVTEKYGTEITLISGADAPTKTGFTFDGWYLDETYTQPADSTIQIVPDARVYAKWEGTVVGYKVVYLTENADDNNYSYAGTVDMTAKAGMNVSANAGTAKPEGFDTKHFTFKEATNEIVSADGSTVVVAKYSRNMYTITFEGTSWRGGYKYVCGHKEHIHEEPYETGKYFKYWVGGCYKEKCSGGYGHTHEKGCFSTTETICGMIEHTHTDACWAYVEAHGNLTITAKYQQYIGDQWNRLVGPGTEYEGSSWTWGKASSGYGWAYTGFQSSMPGENKTISTGTSGDAKRKLYYYVEEEHQNADSIFFNGKYFSEYTEVILKIDPTFTPSYNEEFFVIDGYDRYASTIAAWKDGNNYGYDASWDRDGGGRFYYTKSLYELSLINGDKEYTEKVPYQNDITEKLAEPSYNPLGDGTFDGWYLDPSFQEPYNGDYKMPKGLVLYAKWNPVSYLVTFKDSMDGSEIGTQTVERNKTVDPFIPDKAGYIFKGWYKDAACTTPFDPATQITVNQDVYAKWETSTVTSYTVIHKTSTGEIIKEEGPFTGRVRATVQVNAVKPEGEFAGYIPETVSKTHVLDPDPANNVIEIVYVKADDITYMVEYRYQGQLIAKGTNAEGGTEFHTEANYVKVVADVNKVIAQGYKIKDNQSYKWVTLSAGTNVVIFELEAAEYTIEYDLDGGALAAGTTNPATYKPTEIPTTGIKLNNPEKEGFDFDGWTLTKGKVESGAHDAKETVILPGSYGHLKFTATWCKLHDVTVKYVEKGNIENVLADDKVLKDVRTGAVVNGAEHKLAEAPTGYAYDSAGYVRVSEGNTTVYVYYVKDLDQTKPTSYTVKHVVGGVERTADTKTYEGTVWINEVNPMIMVTEESVSQNTYEGYKYESTEPNVVGGGMVASGTTIVLTYVKDDDQTKPTSYTVKHMVDGVEQSGDTRTYTGTAWVNDPDPQIRVVEGSITPNSYRGYKYVSISPEVSVGSNVPSGTTITLTYVKDGSQTQPTSYTVKHRVGGVEQEADTKTYTSTAWINDTNPYIVVKNGSVDQNNYEGYKYDKTSPDVKAGESVANGTVIILDYVKDDSQTQETSYTVKHVVGGVEKAEDTQTYKGTAWINDETPQIVIKNGSVTPKVYTGYKYEKISPTVKEGDSVDSGTVITLTYVKDDDQTKGTSYIVKHVVGGVEQTEDTRTYKGTAWINDENPQIVVQKGSVNQNSYQGFRYVSTTPDVKSGDKISSGTVITLTYVKDDSQTQDTTYIVKHVVGGVEQTKDTKTYQGTAWINDKEPQIVVKAGSVDQKVYKGYKYDGMNPSVKAGDRVASGTEIILTYVKDTEQTQPTSYTVKHIVDGVEQTEDTRTYEGTAWINDTDPRILVEAGSVAPKVYVGYKYSSMNPAVKAGDSVASGTTITLIYVRDELQTQDTAYIVKHVVDGEERTGDTKTYTGTAWINDEDPQIVVEEGSVDPKVYTGYKYVSMDPIVKAGDSVRSDTVITLTYVKDVEQIQPTSYTVKHVVDGVEQTEDTRTYSGTAWINDTAPMILVRSGSVDPKEYTGYKYTGMNPITEAGDEIASGTVITLTYEKDDSQIQETTYIVKHVVDGVEQTDDTQTYYGTAWINDKNPQITIVEGSVDQKVYIGYKYDEMSPSVKAGDHVASGTEITLTYVKDNDQTQKTSYTVKHVVDGEEKTADTKSYEGTAWINDENPQIAIINGTVKPNNYEGYKFESMNPEVVDGGTVANGTVITLTYVRDNEQTKELKYTVEHYIGLGENAKKYGESDVVVQTVWVNDLDELQVEDIALRTISGYKYNHNDYNLEKALEEESLVGAGTIVNEGVIRVYYARGHLTIAKETTSSPAENNAYALGEKITYRITAVNDGDLTLSDVIVTDALTGNIEENAWIVGSMAPGESREFSAEYVVQEMDVLNGSVKNVATAAGKNPDGSEPDIVPGETDDPIAGQAPSLFIKKEATSGTSGYELNAAVSYKITVINNGNVTISNVAVVDEKTGMNETISSLAPGKQKELTTTYTVTEQDILAGTIINVAKADGTDPNNENVHAESTATVTTVTKNGHISVVKTTTSTPKNGTSYALGETIKYEITATNDGNLTVTDVVVVDELTGDEWTIASFAPGESEKFTAEHVVTEADVLAGKVVNVATAKGTSPDPEKPEVPVDPGEKEDPTDPKNGHLTITKETTSEPANGETYALGETIEYKVTATNDGNLTLTDITVEDKLTKDVWKIDSLEPTESKEFTAKYVVTEADVLAGKVVNVATAKGTSPDPDKPDVPVDPGEKEDPTDPKNGHLTITKETTSIPLNGKTYALGETIEYKIIAANDGNLTLADIIVTDELTGDEWQIGSLEPGASKNFTAKYVVTEADVLVGKVVNVATAKGTSPDPDKPDVPVDPGEKEDPTDPKNGHLTIAKETINTPVNGETYALGETIEYKITATNDGNLTLTNITVVDALTKDEWKIDSLEPTKSKDFTAKYVVTEADVRAGKVVNVATAKGTSPDPEKPDPGVDPGEKDVPTDKIGPSLFVEKTAPQTYGTVSLGETVMYEIRVLNNGNVTVKDIKVTDDLTGESWTIAELAPKASQPFTTKYVVKEADIVAGKIVNVATATGKDPDGKDVTGKGTKEVTSDVQKRGLSVRKEITNDGFVEGTTVFNKDDTINYKITVTNTGNVTLNDVLVQDVTTGKGTVKIKTDGILGTNLLGNYTVDGTNVKIKSLAPGATIEIECSYVVVSGDNGTKVVNTAIAGEGDLQKKDDASADVKKTSSTSGGGSGGGSGSRPGGGGSTSGGPGVPTTTIDPEAVPLASLPTDNSELLAMIDDEDVPLAALPKTGQRSAASLMLMLSGMMLAAFAVVTRKKEDKQ